jgi:hypothetical protein
MNGLVGIGRNIGERHVNSSGSYLGDDGDNDNAPEGEGGTTKRGFKTDLLCVGDGVYGCGGSCAVGSWSWSSADRERGFAADGFRSAMDYAMRQAACDRQTGSRDGRIGGRSDRSVLISLGRTMDVIGLGWRPLRCQPFETSPLIAVWYLVLSLVL